VLAGAPQMLGSTCPKAARHLSDSSASSEGRH
jgi:hypothetical protein